MSITKFYLEVFSSLHKHKVDYMLVGGHAVNYHGYVRSTMDLDIWVSKNENNLQNFYKALLQLGYSEANSLNAIEHFKENHIIKIPKDNHIIDVLDSFIMIKDFEDVFKNHEVLIIDDIKINVISFDDLVEIKSKSNRTKDMLDVKELNTLKLLRTDFIKKGKEK